MQLHDGDALLCLDRTRQAPQSRDMIVRPDAQLPGESFSDRLHVRGTGHRQAEAALRAHGEPAEFLFGQAAVFMALPVCQGSQHKAVLHGRPVAEAQRVQQMRHRSPRGDVFAVLGPEPDYARGVLVLAPPGYSTKISSGNRAETVTLGKSTRLLTRKSTATLQMT